MVFAHAEPQLPFFEKRAESDNYTVRRIPSKQTHNLILNVHYAGRVPPISFAFGLFRADELVGVVTYGSPSSAPLRVGIAGSEHAQNVLELNRLCLVNNLKNEASMLVSRSLKMLPKPRIVVSYADSTQNHVGYVYQACNFFYTGLSAKRTDWKVKGLEHLHGQTIADEFQGKGRAAKMRDKYGDNFYLSERSRKHRYVYLLGNYLEKSKMLAALNYDIQKYPKAPANDNRPAADEAAA